MQETVYWIKNTIFSIESNTYGLLDQRHIAYWVKDTEVIMFKTQFCQRYRGYYIQDTIL